MVRVRVRVFIILSHVLELLITEAAVKCLQRRCDLISKSELASNEILSCFPLIFCFLLLSLGVEASTLRYSRLYHSNILARLPQASQVSLNLERNRVNATVPG